MGYLFPSERVQTFVLGTCFETVGPRTKAPRAPVIVGPLGHAVVVVATTAPEVLAAVATGAPKAAPTGPTAAAGVLTVIGAQEATKTPASGPTPASPSPAVTSVAVTVVATHAAPVGARAAPVGGVVVLTATRVLAGLAARAVATTSAAFRRFPTQAPSSGPTKLGPSPNSGYGLGARAKLELHSVRAR